MDAIDWPNAKKGTVFTNKITGEALIKIDNNKGLLTRCDKTFEVVIEEYKNEKNSKQNYFAAMMKENDTFKAWLPITKQFWS